MKKILLTGASGLLGKSVLKELINNYNYNIYAITTNPDKLKQYENINIIKCDLTNVEDRQEIFKNIKPDICIHLAWDQTKEDFRMSDSNFLWLNISFDILEQFHKNGGKHFLFAGSSSEYDGMTGTFDESADSMPSSLYGLCKKSFNEFAIDYCKKNKISFIGMRYFTIFGADDSHSFGAIPYITSNLKNNEKIVCKSPNITRDYIYVEDAAKITCKLLESDFEGIINVASGQMHTMKEVFQIIGKLFNKLELVEILENNQEISYFNADITLLKNIGLAKYITNFEEAIKKEYLS